MQTLTTMVEKVDDYVQTRQKLGYDLKVTARELRRFAVYADYSGHHGPLTVELALQWARAAAECSPVYQARRIEMVRTFATYRAAFEVGTQIPPRGLLGPAHQRIQPYIFSHQETVQLMDAASRLIPVNGLRPYTYKILLGLLASTGLRVCEALKLNRDSVDLSAHVLTVRETKFHKSRIIPIHESVATALCAYCRFRDDYRNKPCSDRFLLSEYGKALLPSVVHYTFQKLRATLELDTYTGRPPRLYDFRHTFACRRIQRWYEDGVDVNNAILNLSVYLGHVKPSDTYWYLSGIPDLLAVAATRFEHFCEEFPEGAR